MKGGSSTNTPAQMPISSGGCNYTDGAQYVGCQVAAKGWPSPSGMLGGKKSSACRICKHRICKCQSSKRRDVKRGGCGCVLTGGKSNKRHSSRGKKGGFMGLVNEAIVPFGLFALQKRTQKRVSAKRSVGKYRKSYRK